MEENINKNKNIFYSIWIKIFLLIISEISALMLPVASIGLFIHEYLRKRGNGSYGVIVSKLTDMKWFYSEKSAYRRMEFIAVLEALLKFFSPSDFESIALVPTPVPAPTAITKFCSGNAIVTALNAFSPSCATKIESTTLYKACTSMETIIGNDIFIISFFTGITPILLV